MDAEQTQPLPTVPLTQLIPDLPPHYNYDAGIDAALEGLTWPHIAKAIGCDKRTLYRLRRKYLPFNNALSYARACANEYIADDLRTICQDHPELHDKPQVLKAMFDAGRWFLACADPKKYGDRMNLVIEEKVDLRGSLEQARARVLTVLASSTEAVPLDQKTSASDGQAIDK